MEFEQFKKKFEHKNINFVVDEFEELTMQDTYRNDPETTIQLNRNVTGMFDRWIKSKIDKKENISISIKGGTRTGKSISMLAVVLSVINYQNSQGDNKVFDTEKIVCGNQKEYRQKLMNVEFGDMFQIDENAFANVGMGSVTEMRQLVDIQNIVAKQNIHTFYITPKVFLETNASLGLQTWGKDSNNWISRFILFDLRMRTTPILGKVIIDVGKVFTSHGCYLFKSCGGCTNPKKLKIKDLNEDDVRYSSCISDSSKFKVLTTLGSKYKGDYIKIEEVEILDDRKSCPFYNNCSHPLNKYEKKKDRWIAKELSGGMDDRVRDRYETAIKLAPKVMSYSEGLFNIETKGLKHMKIMINMYVGSLTNTKYTQLEIDELAVMVTGFKDLDFYKECCTSLNIDYNKELKKFK